MEVPLTKNDSLCLALFFQSLYCNRLCNNSRMSTNYSAVLIFHSSTEVLTAFICTFRHFSTFAFYLLVIFYWPSSFIIHCFCTSLFAVYVETFTQSDYHRLALQKLEECPVAMESLGAPPLRVYNIHLTDRQNCVDPQRAQVLWRGKPSIGTFTWLFQHCCTLCIVLQIKIPVTGSKTGGYLYTSSIRDPDTNRWVQWKWW